MSTKSASYAPRELGGISFFFFSGILVLFSRKKEDPKDKGPGPGLGVLLKFVGSGSGSGSRVTSIVVVE